MSENKKIQSLIKNRKFVRMGSLMMSDEDYKIWVNTHCQFCKKETHENYKYFGEVCCQNCKNEFDPNFHYERTFKNRGRKWK